MAKKNEPKSIKHEKKVQTAEGWRRVKKKELESATKEKVDKKYAPSD